MNRTDRLTGIILALRGGRQTASQLATRFEVSRRTILRDVAALGEIGVPVVTAPGVGGGLELAEDYWLPPLHLSSDEATLLLLALGSLGEVDGSPFGEERRTVEEKLRAALRPEVAREADEALRTLTIAPPSGDVRQHHLRTLRAAIRRGNWVIVTYRSVRRLADRCLLPRRLFVEGGRWYCVAVDLEAAEERRFRLDRMESVEPTSPPPGAAEALRSATAPRPAYDDLAHPEVVVRLTESGLRRAEVEPALVENARPVAGGGWEARFRCPPVELPYYGRILYALGPEAEVIGPAEVREMIRDWARATADRHAAAEPGGNGDGPLSPSEA
jgi:predicted DNA-binding transcriptional regulator YafY